MKSLYIPVFLAIIGNILYHISQKSIPKTANPFFSIIIAYIVGIIICIFASFFYTTDRPFFSTIKDVNWAVVVVGIAAMLIEIGFLLAYRTGWNISFTGTLVGAVGALLLIPIGMIAYKEKISIWNLLGILLSILGLALVSIKTEKS